MERELQPHPRVKLRWILFGVLLLPALISSATWYEKLFAALLLAFVVGTYRQSRICGDRFESGMILMFKQLRVRKWKLDRVVVIETEVATRADLGTVVLFAPLWAFLRICGWLLPWLGGEIKLWLRSAKGKRVLAWQGNSEEHYQTNLEMLQTATGAEVQRA